MKRFYATFVEALFYGNYEVAIFKSKKERDEWVDYHDELSTITNTTAENSAFTRVALTESTAEKIMSHCTDYTKDKILSNLTWAKAKISD